MTDLEMVKRCAEAMEIRVELFGSVQYPPEHWRIRWRYGPHGTGDAYDPLCDDEQAMALVKKFELEIDRVMVQAENFDYVGCWRVRTSNPHNGEQAHSADLNRAIVECVAKMQAKP